MTAPDRRRNAWRADLAAAYLKGTVEAARFVEGTPRRIVAAAAPLRREPRADCPLDTELLRGETVMLYEARDDGWAWVQNGTDGYVGWLALDALGDPSDAANEDAPSHKVAALRSFRYPGPDLRFPALDCLSMEARVRVTGEAVTRGTAYALLSDGSAMVASHLVPLDHAAADWVAVAEGFLGTPYLWGGRTSVGLDCSALVQLALAAGGIAAPRDSDMQEAELGTPLDISDGLPPLARGDLVFWKGHVGIMRDAESLLHANGHTMSVAIEPLVRAVERIAAAEFGAVTAVKRL